MHSAQHSFGSKKNPPEKKSRPPVAIKEKIVVHPFEQNIDVIKYANRDFYIPISLPNGVKGTTNNNTPDELYLEATLNMIEEISTALKDYQLSIGNVYVLVTGSITHNDYLLKFQDNIEKILSDIAKTHRDILIELSKKENPEKEIAAFLGLVMQPYADEIEKIHLKKYADYISKREFSFPVGFIEWKNFKKKAEYAEKLVLINEKIEHSAKKLGWSSYAERKAPNPSSFNSDDLFLENLYTAAVAFVTEKGIIGNNKKKSSKPRDFPMKGSPLEVVISQSQKILYFLAIDWFKVYVEGSYFYLTEEGPFFLIADGELAYKKAAFMQKIFQILLNMNPKATFFQIHSTVKEIKSCTQIKGFSSTYEKIGSLIKFLPTEPKASAGSPVIDEKKDEDFDGKHEEQPPVEIKILYHSPSFFQPRICQRTLLQLVNNSTKALCSMPTSDLTTELLQTNSLVMTYLKETGAHHSQTSYLSLRA